MLTLRLEGIMLGIGLGEEDSDLKNHRGHKAGPVRKKRKIARTRKGGGGKGSAGYGGLAIM
jgi:hypothetical protein